MNFKKRLFVVFLSIGIAIFLLGRTCSPFLFADRTFATGIDMRVQLRDLRYALMESIEKEDPGLKQVEAKLGQVEMSLEGIMDEARKRHHSKWPTDLLAIVTIVGGLILTLMASWRADVHRLAATHADATPNRRS